MKSTTNVCDECHGAEGGMFEVFFNQRRRELCGTHLDDVIRQMKQYGSSSLNVRRLDLPRHAEKSERPVKADIRAINRA